MNPINYTNPGWANGNEPALNADNLNEMTEAAEALATYANENPGAFIATSETKNAEIAAALEAGQMVAMKYNNATTTDMHLLQIVSNPLGIPDITGWRIAYGGGRFVALGTGDYTSALHYSLDGLKWKTKIMGMVSQPRPKCICYGAGKFVFLGNDIPSFSYWDLATDAVVHEEFGSNVTDNISRFDTITYGHAGFIVTGRGQSTFIQSTDGINWSVGTLPSASDWSYSAYGAGRYILVGYNSGTVAYSTDGANWVQTSMASASNSTVNAGMCYGNGRFVVIGINHIQVSRDGVAWKVIDETWGGSGVCFGDGYFMSIGNVTGAGYSAGYLHYSRDGSHWNSVMTNNIVGFDCAYGFNRFVSVPTASIYGSTAFTYCGLGGLAYPSSSYSNSAFTDKRYAFCFPTETSTTILNNTTYPATSSTVTLTTNAVDFSDIVDANAAVRL